MRDIFEKALFENPDDLTTYSAYADWMMEQNDPRGEFVQVQLRLEQTSDETERKSLRKRSRELQSLHEENWLGGLARTLLGRGSEEYSHIFARGWLHTLAIRVLRLTVARTIARSPAVSLLRELNVYSVPWEAPGRPRAAVALLASPRLVNLQTIRFDQFSHGDEVCRALVQSNRMKHLRTLSLKRGNIGSEGANFLLGWPGLRDLTWLDLSDNRIPHAKCDEIEKIVPHASLGVQSHEQTEVAAPEVGTRDDLYDDNWE